MSPDVTGPDAPSTPASAFRWGLQLPIQSKSPTFVQPWEISCGADELAAVAVAAERAGADYIAVCDHIAVPLGRVADIGETWFDTVATLAWLGARTTRVRLMSHVYVLPYRSAYMTAKQFGTLDALTGGRAVLGVGAGHVESEFELLGADFDRRGATLDEAITAVRRVWRNDDEAAVVSPAPAQAGGPPILIGGSSSRALRRAAEMGDGWLPQGVPASGFAAAIGRLRDAVAGRTGPGWRPFEVHMHLETMRVGESVSPSRVPGRFEGSADQIAERLSGYRRLGADVHQARLAADSVADYCDQLGRFGEVVAALG